MAKIKRGKRILISGAGSGFGELTAIGLAKAGHDVIAGAQIWPQVTQLRLKAEKLGVKNLRVENLDILDSYDIENAVNWDVDILVNNAAILDFLKELVRRCPRRKVFLIIDNGPCHCLEEDGQHWLADHRTASSCSVCRPTPRS